MENNKSDVTYPVIGRDAQFYGYVIGLNVEPWGDLENGSQRLLATFEHGGRVTVWEVPDFSLFEELWKHLSGNAYHRRKLGEYGYDKVWIEWKDSKWEVDLP